jgi:KDO2-lipid IV(A) lauroyltransferase
MTGKEIRYRIEALLLRPALAFFRVLGLDRASAFGGGLARFLGPKLGISRRAQRNIERAMPALSAAEVAQIVAGMWENLGRTVAEYAHLDHFALPEERHRIEIVGMEHIRLLAREGRGGLLLSGHFANWELMPLAMHLEGFECGEVYRRANNPYVDEWMVNMRRQITGATQIPKGPKGGRDILRLVRNNQFLAMLVDQKMSDGVEAKLFGRRAMTTSAPAGLAVRYETPIIPACIERTHGAHFRITVYDPIEARKDADPFEEILRLTQAVNDFLEERIRARPHEWFWLHNRWPDS